MNPTLQAQLDTICKSLAAKHSTSERLVNLFIQVQLASAKLGIIATFATSKVINVQESIGTLNDEIVNIAVIGGALAGFKDDEAPKLMAIYQEIHSKVQPLLTAYYSAAGNKSESPS